MPCVRAKMRMVATITDMPNELLVELTPASGRVDPEAVPRPVAMLQAEVLDAASTGWHSHSRPQLLYSTRGLVTVDFEATASVVPEGHALLISAHTKHKTSCSGAISFCAVYIDLAQSPGERAQMLQVSPLLGSLLQALAEEPILYDGEGRAGCLAKLILDELQRAPRTSFPLPMPTDRRLRKLCQTLIETPALDLNIDGWALQIGVSRRTLTRRFRAETDLTFAEWRRRLRALRATTQRSKGMSDQVAAEAAGYGSGSALRTMIKRLEVTSEEVRARSAKIRRTRPGSRD